MYRGDFMSDLHGGRLKLTANASQERVAQKLRDRSKGLLVAYELSDRNESFEGAALEIYNDGEGPEPQLRSNLTPMAQERLGLDQASTSRSDQNISDLRSALSGKADTYSRLVENVVFADLPSDTALTQLTRAIGKVPPSSSPSGIPVQFTYLGQFVAHDLAHTNFEGDPYDVENMKSAALDLSSIFSDDSVPCGNPDDEMGVGGVRLGLTDPRNGLPSRLEDLPRDQDGCPGRSCLPDTRNDANLALSQLTVLILKFYRLIFEECGSDVADAQRITRRHIQSMVLHDFLPRLLYDKSYLADPLALNTFKRRIVNSEGEPKLFQVPVEFATAFFRFGHSMVRGEYDWTGEAPNKDSLTLSDVLKESHSVHLASSRSRVRDDWVIDWDAFTDQQFAAPIDCGFQKYLTQLSPELVDQPPAGYTSINLAALSLQRGKTLQLPTTQAFQCFLDDLLEPGSPERERIAPDQLLSKCDGGVGSHLEAAALCELRESTPLFFYTLREAELWSAGQRLGPVASRIVLETIHGAISAADDNILTGECFSTHPSLPIPQAKVFRFSDLLGCIQPT